MEGSSPGLRRSFRHPSYVMRYRKRRRSGALLQVRITIRSASRMSLCGLSLFAGIDSRPSRLAEYASRMWRTASVPYCGLRKISESMPPSSVRCRSQPLRFPAVTGRDQSQATQLPILRLLRTHPQLLYWSFPLFGARSIDFGRVPFNNDCIAATSTRSSEHPI